LWDECTFSLAYILKRVYKTFSSTRVRFFCFTVILVPKAHDPFGLRQGCLAQTKRIVGSGDESVSPFTRKPLKLIITSSNLVPRMKRKGPGDEVESLV